MYAKLHTFREETEEIELVTRLKMTNSSFWILVRCLSSAAGVLLLMSCSLRRSVRTAPLLARSWGLPAALPCSRAHLLVLCKAEPGIEAGNAFWPSLDQDLHA